MNIDNILTEYDNMFGRFSLSKIEDFLYEKICEAVSEGDGGAIITLLNEMIGLCRDTSQREKALTYCTQLKNMLDRMGMEGTKNYATSMQNIANAYRAFGLWDEAEEAFRLIEKTYDMFLDKGDYLWASMYNNWGLLYQEQREYEKSVKVLMKAYDLIKKIPATEIKQAITCTNLANSLFSIKTENSVEQGYFYIKSAISIFVEDGERDFHYGAALVAMGDYCVIKNELKTARKYYQKGLVEILIHTGKTDYYNRVLEKYNNAKANIEKTNTWISNLQRSEEFYKKYGSEMIHELFSQYESIIAVGMVGEGSDCFGFDDEISTDHDYEVGFCMWVTAEDYEKIGKNLQTAYNELMKKHGLKKEKNPLLEQRRGVFVVEGFYGETHDEVKLSEMTNGKIFRDDMGTVSGIRRQLHEYYPEDIWRKKLANLLHEFSQYAQCNYARMMSREDYLTASLCISKAIESAMDIVYVLNKKYAPYYKWKRKGLEQMGVMPEVLWITNELSLLPCQKKAWEERKYEATQINIDDKRVVLLELLAKILLEEMRRQKLVSGDDVFLESYIGQILKGDENLIDKIVELEWMQFDKVKNKGGRADCQNDFNTFSLMRKSQYMTWNDELLKSYYNDLMAAEERGWNLIMEKYARMMKSTAPDEYSELENELPKRSEERNAIAEEIIKIQVSWMEDFAKKYPKMAGNARSIHTYEDNEYNTSYETYLRGELGTYSEETFVLYGRFIASLLKEERNLAYETMNNTAILYGYESVESAESRL